MHPARRRGCCRSPMAMARSVARTSAGWIITGSTFLARRSSGAPTWPAWCGRCRLPLGGALPDLRLRATCRRQPTWRRSGRRLPASAAVVVRPNPWRALSGLLTRRILHPKRLSQSGQTSHGSMTCGAPPVMRPSKSRNDMTRKTKATSSRDFGTTHRLEAVAKMATAAAAGSPAGQALAALIRVDPAQLVVKEDRIDPQTGQLTRGARTRDPLRMMYAAGHLQKDRLGMRSRRFVTIWRSRPAPASARPITPGSAAGFSHTDPAAAAV